MRDIFKCDINSGHRPIKVFKEAVRHRLPDYGDDILVEAMPGRIDIMPHRTHAASGRRVPDPVLLSMLVREITRNHHMLGPPAQILVLAAGFSPAQRDRVLDWLAAFQPDIGVDIVDVAGVLT